MQGKPMTVDELRREVDVHQSNVEYWLKEAAKAEAKVDYRDMHKCRDNAEREGWHADRYERAATRLASYEAALREIATKQWTDLTEVQAIAREALEAK